MLLPSLLLDQLPLCSCSLVCHPPDTSPRINKNKKTILSLLRWKPLQSPVSPIPQSMCRSVPIARESTSSAALLRGGQPTAVPMLPGSAKHSLGRLGPRLARFGLVSPAPPASPYLPTRPESNRLSHLIHLSCCSTLG